MSIELVCVFQVLEIFRDKLVSTVSCASGLWSKKGNWKGPLEKKIINFVKIIYKLERYQVLTQLKQLTLNMISQQQRHRMPQ